MDTALIIYPFINSDRGPFKCYVTQMGVGGGSDFLEKSVTKV